MFRIAILIIAKRIKNAKQIFKYFDYQPRFGLFGYYMEGTKFFVSLLALDRIRHVRRIFLSQ
jgi:hypothetical protein